MRKLTITLILFFGTWMNVNAQVVFDKLTAQNNKVISFCKTQYYWEEHLKKSGKYNSPTCPVQGPCDLPDNRDAGIPNDSTPVKVIKLLFNAFRYDDGSGGAAADSIDSMMIRVNRDFAPWKFRFTYTIRFIDDSKYVIYRMENKFQMYDTYAQYPEQQINVYVVDSFNGGIGTSPWGGVALTNNGGIIIGNTVVGKRISVLTHELGHNLGLWHTFRIGGVCSNPCYEKVESSAAKRDSTGDYCSDTPPTDAFGERECSFPSGTDNCSVGNPPWGLTMPENFMSYGIFSLIDSSGFVPCHTTFTPQQAGRMHCWVEDALASYLDTTLLAVTDNTISNSNALLKNIPNPFKNTTTIIYSLDGAATKGEIRLYNMFGRMLESHPITSKSSKLELDCSSYAPGVYFYSLFVNDAMIATKKMVIIE